MNSVERYKALAARLSVIHAIESEILDEMDDLWYNMTAEECDEVDQHRAKAKSNDLKA